VTYTRHGRKETEVNVTHERKKGRQRNQIEETKQGTKLKGTRGISGVGGYIVEIDIPKATP
jgi:hypothetical protein